MKTWTKTRQILLSRIAPSLQGRINFIREEFTTNKVKYWSADPVFRVTVDGKTWFADCRYGYTHPRFLEKELLSKSSFAHKNPDWRWQKFGSIENSIHEYLNVLPLEKCLVYDNGFYNILAVLDYRLGKRRLRKMLDEIDDCPDFLYKWILLRAEAEGLLKKKREIQRQKQGYELLGKEDVC